MLLIRTEQMDVFKERALGSFKDQMFAHLREFSPPLFKAIGEEPMREAIHLGVRRASTYGFTFRGPVRLYLELMLLFGSHFDTDPQYPWAARILADMSIGHQMQRAKMLYAKTVDYRQKVAGPENTFAIDALKNALLLAKLPLPLPSALMDFGPAVTSLIARIYPQKAAYVGAKGVEALIRKGTSTQGQHISTARGAALVVGLMFTFGEGCAKDPLYPWIRSILQDQAIADPSARVGLLESRTIAFLTQILADIEEGA
jgi:hypothetical protein